MNYTVAFDVLKTGYQWHHLVIPFVFVLISAVSLFTNGKYSKPSSIRTFRTIFFSFFLGFAVLICGLVFLINYSDYRNLASALQNGRCQITEGQVTEFDPMPWSGHRYETFTISGHHFAYSDYVATAGFNNTSSHGGPIREGEFMRIHHVGNEIARLEVAK